MPDIANQLGHANANGSHSPCQRFFSVPSASPPTTPRGSWCKLINAERHTVAERSQHASPARRSEEVGAGVGDAWWPTLENALWCVRGVIVRDAIHRWYASFLHGAHVRRSCPSGPSRARGGLGPWCNTREQCGVNTTRLSGTSNMRVHTEHR